jgi:plastocyanin
MIINKHFKIPLLLASLLILLLLILMATYTYREQPKKMTVLMTDWGFEPANLKIKKGTIVTFKNTTNAQHWPASNIHPTHGIYPEFDPLKEVGPGQEWSFKFSKTGKWRFHDHLFPEFGGIIEVSN